MDRACHLPLFLCPRSRHMRTRFLAFLGGFVFFVILHFVLKWEGGDESAFANLDIDIPHDFIPVQKTERETFPTQGNPRIPKLIHQTWKSPYVPPEFSGWIKSWLAFHPDYEYWLWTDESARQLIAEKYPKLLDIFDGYTEPIRRADALRYVVLYEYGGIYVDMDMEALSSLEPLTLKYSCFVGQEPYEHPIIDTNFEQLLINALIGCRKGHPFMKMLIDKLPAYSILWHYLDSTGPHFVTMIYRQYQVKYPVLEDNEDGLYIAASEYFYPTIDPAKLGYMFSRCSQIDRLTELQKNACRNLKFKNLPGNDFRPLSIAFTNHHWYHTYLRNFLPSAVKGYRSILEIVPHAKMYKDMQRYI